MGDYIISEQKIWSKIFMKFLLVVFVVFLTTLFNVPGNALEDMEVPASAAAATATAQHEMAKADILNENERWHYINICSEEPFGYQWARKPRFHGLMHGETYGYQKKPRTSPSID